MEDFESFIQVNLEEEDLCEHFEKYDNLELLIPGRIMIYLLV